MAYRDMGPSTFPELSNIERFVDAQQLSVVSEQGFRPLGIFNGHNPHKSRILQVLIEGGDHTTLPVQFPVEAVACVEGFVCLFGRCDETVTVGDDQPQSSDTLAV